MTDHDKLVRWLDYHGACDAAKTWAYKNAKSLSAAWLDETLRPDWALWAVLRPGVLDRLIFLKYFYNTVLPPLLSRFNEEQQKYLLTLTAAVNGEQKCEVHSPDSVWICLTFFDGLENRERGYSRMARCLYRATMTHLRGWASYAEFEDDMDLAFGLVDDLSSQFGYERPLPPLIAWLRANTQPDWRLPSERTKKVELTVFDE